MWELYVKDAEGWKLYGTYQYRSTAIGLSSRFMNRGKFCSTIVVSAFVKENFFLKNVRDEARLRGTL